MLDSIHSAENPYFRLEGQGGIYGEQSLPIASGLQPVEEPKGEAIWQADMLEKDKRE